MTHTAVTRTTRQVLEDHLSLRQMGDIEADLARNFADDVVVLTSRGEFRGKDEVRRASPSFLAVEPILPFVCLRLVRPETSLRGTPLAPCCQLLA